MATDGPVEELGATPRLTSLYARAVRSGGGGATGLPATTVVQGGVAVDPDAVAAYAGVCDFALTDALPPPYLHLLTFPLSIHLMAGDDFPFPLLGMVHVHQRIVVHAPVTAADEVDLAVRLEDLRPHGRGRQFDVHATAAVADEVVWTGRSTYLHRDGSGADGPQEPVPARPRPTDAVDPATLPTTARWRVDADTGRRYAAVSGDRNPIHLTTLTARPFGFRRPIAHGMWTLARSVAALEGRIGPTPTIDVAFRSPLLLPSTVEYATARRDDDWLVGVRGTDGRPHLVGVVAPSAD